eukprot:1137677-Pelagomonas_calceolata.AAC.2
MGGSQKFPAEDSNKWPDQDPPDSGKIPIYRLCMVLNPHGHAGGSADLSVSNLTLVKIYGDFQKDQVGPANADAAR